MVEIKLLKVGYCTQIEKVILKNGKFKKIIFPATCALIKHSTEGYILFDTGYSKRVLKDAPLLYRLITPITFNEENSLINQLQRHDISPDMIKTIIISHFHADHIGGLRDFPKAKFICSKEAFDSIQHLKGLKALMAAFIPSLIPDDFTKRLQFIESNDLLGDGSLIAINLPGHAAGQVGIMVDQKILLAADACWTSAAYREYLLPHPLVKLIIHDYKAFKKTLLMLHQLHLKHPEIKIIPTHCEEAVCTLL